MHTLQMMVKRKARMMVTRMMRVAVNGVCDCLYVVVGVWCCGWGVVLSWCCGVWCVGVGLPLLCGVMECGVVLRYCCVVVLLWEVVVMFCSTLGVVLLSR